jgi:hypothetical protein
MEYIWRDRVSRYHSPGRRLAEVLSANFITWIALRSESFAHWEDLPPLVLAM